MYYLECGLYSVDEVGSHVVYSFGFFFFFNICFNEWKIFDVLKDRI